MITNMPTKSIITTRNCNRRLVLKCRNTRKYAKAFGMKAMNDCSAPPSHPVIASDMNVDRASPINARNCGVLIMDDFIKAGIETRKTRTARINSIRASANRPNTVVGER